MTFISGWVPASYTPPVSKPSAPSSMKIVIGNAWFSDDETYRYKLTRHWGNQMTPRMLTWIMLNPSTADYTDDDPTVAKCQRYAHAWGYEGIIVLNLFAYRSTDPKGLYRAVSEGVDIIGPENDEYLRAELMRLKGNKDWIMVAWGNHGALLDRGAAVLSMLRGHPVRRFGLTKAGQPKHPLYLPADAEPEVQT